PVRPRKTELRYKAQGCSCGANGIPQLLLGRGKNWTRRRPGRPPPAFGLQSQHPPCTWFVPSGVLLMRPVRLTAAVLAVALALSGSHGQTPRLKILFLGDDGPHRPAERFRQLQPVLAARGIDLTYTDKVDALNADTLARYDGLVIYANHTKITP